MKKRRLLILAVLMLAFTAIVSGQTATIQTVNNASPGAVSVAITLSGFNQTVPSISAFQWTVQYDNSKLIYQNVTPVSPLDGWTTHTPSAGRLTFVVVPAVSFNANSPTIVCYMNFTYSGSGSAFLNWSDNPTPRYIYDDNIDDYFTITWVNGSVNPIVGTAPSINTHPTSVSVCSPSAASFSVDAAGTAPLSYQWQLSTNGGGSWVNQANGGIYSGMTTSTMNISAASSNMNNYRYRCFVSNIMGVTVSNAAILTVNVLPSVVAHPPNRTLCANAITTFSVTAIGTSPGYQWQVSTNGGSSWANLSNSAPYSTVTTSTLNISGVTAGMNSYQYRCYVLNICGNTTSNVGLLTVNSPPFININPQSQTINPGGTATFSVTSSGTTPNYQWQISTNGGTTFTNLSNGGSNPGYSGVTTSTMSISGCTLGMNSYLYRCYVSNMCNYATTQNGMLMVVTSNSPTCTIDSVAGFTGSTVAVPLKMKNFNQTNPGVSAFQWTVQFDNTNLTYVNTNNFYPNDGWTMFTPSAGKVTFVVVPSASFPADTEVTVCTMNFIINGSSGCYNVSWSDVPTPRYIYDDNIEDYYGINWINGKVCVSTCTAVGVGTQPSNTSVCAGGNAQFCVTASGTATFTYQWQLSTNGGGSYSNISGATGDCYNLTGATAGMNNYRYRCYLTNCSGANNVTSNAGILTVNPVVSITTQPLNSTICAGANTTFAIAAAGSSLTYQWQLSANGGTTWTNLSNTAPYSNVTSATMNITSATAGMNTYQYRCYIGSSCGNTNSNAGILTVNPAVSITTQPLNSTICVGANTSFAIVAGGSSLTYQWQLSTNGGTTWTNLSNTAPYSNVTSATMNITSATAGMNTYQYRCYMGSSCGNTNSNAAVLTVTAGITITTQPLNATMCHGANASFTVAAGGSSITYQWQLSVNGGTSWTNLTNIPPYSDVTSATMNITAGTTGMNTYQYRCYVGSSCGNTNSNAGILTVNVSTLITSHPAAVIICSGASAQFCVTASGSSPISYQWQLSTNGGSSWNNISGATANCYNLTGVTAGMNGYQYRVLASNSCGSATSNPALLTVNAAPTNVTATATPNPICETQTLSLNGSATGATSWSWSGPNGYSANTQNASISNVNTSHAGVYTVTATNLCGSINASTSAVVVNAPPQITVQPVDTLTILDGGTGAITALSVSGALSYQWQISLNGGLTWANASGTSDPPCNNANTAIPDIGPVDLADNGKYFRCYIIGNCSPDAFSNPVYLQVVSTCAGVSITTHPVSLTLCENEQAVFSVVASGTQPFQYQWQKNGNNISGANNNTYTINAVSLSDAGNYRCYITNCSGANNAVSNDAILTVNALPANPGTISGNDTVCLGSVQTYSVTNFSGVTYTWSLPAGFTGSSTTNSIQVNIGNNAQSGTITVTPDNGCQGPSSSISVFVNNLSVYAGSDQTAVSGDVITLTGSASNGSGNYTYSWSPSSMIASGANTANATTVPLNTSVCFTLTVNDGVCTQSDFMCVNLSGDTTVNIVSMSITPDTICLGETVQLNVIATGGNIATYTYSWTGDGLSANNIQNPTATPTTSGNLNYTAIVSDGFTSDTASISMFVHTPPVADAGSDNAVCASTSVQLNATSDFAQIFLWQPSDNLSNPNIADPIAIPISTITYTVTATYGSCSATDDITITVHDMSISLAYDPASYTFTASPGGYNSYEFFLNGVSVQSASILNTYTNNQLGSGDSVSVHVFDANGCDVWAGMRISIVTEGVNAFTPDGDGINDVFLKGKNIMVFDRWGMQMYSGTEGWDGKFNGKDVPAGTYYYVLKNESADGSIQEVKGTVTVVRK